MKVRTRVPQSIIISALSNSVMALGFSICLLFTIGDANAVTNTPSGVPLIEVYYLATNSKPVATLLTLMPVIDYLFALFNTFASVSRLIWAFAQDKGLPLSKFFSVVSKNKGCNEVRVDCNVKPRAIQTGERIQHKNKISYMQAWRIRKQCRGVVTLH